jgi:hypothetical protein
MTSLDIKDDNIDVINRGEVQRTAAQEAKLSEILNQRRSRKFVRVEFGRVLAFPSFIAFDHWVLQSNDM